jgi:hypothetical protein
MELEQRWHFLDTRRAPCRPEAEQHHAASVAGKVNGGGAIGDRKVRGRLAGLGWMRATVATGRHGQSEKQAEQDESTKRHIFIIRS